MRLLDLNFEIPAPEVTTMKSAALALAIAIGVMGCAHVAHDGCYTESGWLDSSNGCSARAGYPDCYVVCPNAGTRTPADEAAAALPPK